MAPPPTNIRGKEACMTAKDWQDFGDALQEKYPQARYFRDIGRDVQGEKPPEIVMYRHLAAVPARFLDRITMVFDPFWRPTFFKFFYDEEKFPEKWNWVLYPPPHPTVWIALGNAVWTEQGPPHHRVGHLHFYMTPKSKEHAALAARFFRLFGKFATNRGLAHVRYPDYLTTPADKGLDLWCGHDALRWTREDPKRFLHFNGRFGLRPLDATAEVIPFERDRTRE